MARIEISLGALWSELPYKIDLASPIAHFSPSWPEGYEACPERPDGVYYPIIPGGVLYAPGFGDRIRCWYARPRQRSPIGGGVLAAGAFDISRVGAVVEPTSTLSIELSKIQLTVASEPTWSNGNGTVPFSGFELIFPSTLADPARGHLLVGSMAPHGIPRNAGLTVSSRVYGTIAATLANRRYHTFSYLRPNLTAQADWPIMASGLLLDGPAGSLDTAQNNIMESRLRLPGPLSSLDRVDVEIVDFSGGVTNRANAFALSAVSREGYHRTPAIEMRSVFYMKATHVNIAQNFKVIMITRDRVWVSPFQMTPGDVVRGCCSTPVTAGECELHSLSADGTVIDHADLSAGAMGVVNPSPDGLYEVEMINAVWAVCPTFTVWQIGQP